MKTIGVTIKAVLELDEMAACGLEIAPRHTLRVGGVDLERLKIGLPLGGELEPARIWVTVEDVPQEWEDEFLEG